MTDSPDTPTELVQAVHDAPWLTHHPVGICRVLAAVPDGWAKRNGRWVKDEPTVDTLLKGTAP